MTFFMKFPLPLEKKHGNHDNKKKEINLYQIDLGGETAFGGLK